VERAFVHIDYMRREQPEHKLQREMLERHEAKQAARAAKKAARADKRAARRRGGGPAGGEEGSGGAAVAGGEASGEAIV
jgi:hypothetical protein